MKLNLPTVIAIFLTIVAVGCQSGPQAEKDDEKLGGLAGIKERMPWHKEEEPEPGIPVRLVDSWTDTVLHKQGKASQRGFGGRIHFYDEEGGKPILVDGQLVVYAFDETDRDPIDNCPTRRYVFPAEQFTLHMSESKIGPSYSVWLPWDESGGQSKEVSLICRFEPREGTLIVGEQTRQRLPGTMLAAKPRTSPTSALSSAPAVQQAVYTGCDGTCNTTADLKSTTPLAPVTPAIAETPREQMTTTSIALPPHFRKR